MMLFSYFFGRKKKPEPRPQFAVLADGTHHLFGGHSLVKRGGIWYLRMPFELPAADGTTAVYVPLPNGTVVEQVPQFAQSQTT